MFESGFETILDFLIDLFLISWLAQAPPLFQPLLKCRNLSFDLLAGLVCVTQEVRLLLLSNYLNRLTILLINLLGSFH